MIQDSLARFVEWASCPFLIFSWQAGWGMQKGKKGSKYYIEALIVSLLMLGF
ncbi:MAG: hypothetical protein F6K54_15685 [Okeania sp. SIO3B5]|uniref:hypothetical protein n=1 Tax=Okeania sp. SIO3B5 TaxID=2607811 RepID=UPI0013FEF9C4|nr:hypothetical protein [Okeania sp. SIO3B5]NEO54398.1 hypothetical protein [Okeania sp. SIO3B5]